MTPAATPQPAPRPGAQVVLPVAIDLAAGLLCAEIIDDLTARAEQGQAKYGTYLQTNNGRDALLDCYQELLDAVMYSCQLDMEYPSPFTIQLVYRAIELAAFAKIELQKKGQP